MIPWVISGTQGLRVALKYAINIYCFWALNERLSRGYLAAQKAGLVVEGKQPFHITLHIYYLFSTLPTKVTVLTWSNRRTRNGTNNVNGPQNCCVPLDCQVQPLLSLSRSGDKGFTRKHKTVLWITNTVPQETIHQFSQAFYNLPAWR